MARVTISLPDSLHRALKEAAVRRGTTLGDVVRESLVFYGIKTQEEVSELVARARRKSGLEVAEAQALANREARFVFLLSEDLLAEYRAVLLRPAITGRHGLTEAEIDGLLAESVRNGVVRAPERLATSAPDGGDQHLWDLVGSEQGAVLVTGDGELVEKRAREVPALDPRASVEILA